MDDLLFTAGRMGIGAVFMASVWLDIRTRPALFELMTQKHVPLRWLCYLGAISIKLLTGVGLVAGIYIYWSALILSGYTFIANVILNNFWAVESGERRDMTIVLFMVHLAVCFGLLAVAGSLT